MKKEEQADVVINNEVLSNDFSICEAGFEKCRPSKPVEYIPINYWVIHYCIDGEGYFSLTNSPNEHISAGDIFMIPAHCGNRYYPKKNNPWTYRWIGLSGNKVTELLKKCNLSTNDYVIHDAFDENINKIFEEVYQYFKRNNTFGSLSSVFSLFEYLSSKELLPEELGTKEHLLLQITNYIKRHYSDDISVDEVAKVHNIDRSYLFKLFQKYKKITPSHYIQNLKLQKACSLLRKSSLSVTDISYECGFTSPSYFSKFFVDNIGMTPLKYRNRFIIK